MTYTANLPSAHTDFWDWQLHGQCRNANAAVFFHPEGERGPARRRREQQAKAICANCPVIAQCREHALAAAEPYGIWGGLGEAERNEILKARRRNLSRNSNRKRRASVVVSA